MIDWSTCFAVERVAKRVGGAGSFRGTRVPVALFENPEDGAQTAQVNEWFSGVG